MIGDRSHHHRLSPMVCSGSEGIMPGRSQQKPPDARHMIMHPTRSTRGQRKTKDDTTLEGPMAPVRVHAEITAVPIDESSQPDVRDLPSCDALIRYRRHTGL